MRNYLKTTIFVITYTISAFCLITLVSSCISGGKIKLNPEYKATPMELEPYINEYMELSRQNNLSFRDPVTIGFTSIDRGSIIGTCTYGGTFREIDIDSEFFHSASEIRKKALLFHELTHCYCTRGHDFGDGTEYPNNLLKRIGAVIAAKVPWCLDKNVPGFLDDGCASSIMHPVILSDQCLDQHWDYYIKEMFNRCNPW